MRQTKMESDRVINSAQVGTSDGFQNMRPPHGRTTGPTRRSTKGQWSVEEDAMLSQAVQQFNGKNWKKIAECFKDRTDVQCLHRWQKVLNPELVKGPWSKEEDEMIIALVAKYGATKWSTISSHMPGRIGKQCRERWHNHLNPSINKEAWTQEEELDLIRAHRIYGNKWAELTKFLPGRTDNSIKNHWNSSVKKKLDSYLASGLISQVQGLPPVVGHQNQSNASSSSRMQHSSGDDCVPRDATEAEDISECSQGSTFVGGSQGREHLLTGGYSQGMEQRSRPSSFSQPHYSVVEEINFAIPESPYELGCPVIEQDFSQEIGTSANYQEIGNVQSFASQLYYPARSDISETSLCQYMPSAPQFHPVNYLQCISVGTQETDFFARTHEDFIYTTDAANFDCEVDTDNVYTQQQNYQTMHPTNLVPVDTFTSGNYESMVMDPVNEMPVVKSDRIQDTDGSLFYEPPRFPSFDTPFFSCDLVQSGSDMHQEFSPLGLRQVISSDKCFTPLRLWGSPSRDGSPDAVLKSAAKTFTGTPSILKRRHRDFLSPLSERRGDKKIEIDFNQKRLSSLAKKIVHLDAIFPEKAMSPSSYQKKNCEAFKEYKENLNIGVECGNVKGRDRTASLHDKRNSEDKKRITVGNDAKIKAVADKTEQIPSGVLVEHNVNQRLFFSPDRFGSKAEKVFESSTLPNQPNLSLNPCIPVVTSSSVNGKKQKGVAITSIKDALSSTPLKNIAGSENATAFGESPFKRSLGSPPAWMSPWFFNSFLPGPKVDTEITIEDFGLYMSPVDRSYDAIGLMKQLSEHTAAAFASAQEVLGNDTPETILKQRRSNNNHLPSDFSTERRILDFSECGTPRKSKENTKFSNGAIPSPSSHLMNCR